MLSQMWHRIRDVLAKAQGQPAHEIKPVPAKNDCLILDTTKILASLHGRLNSRSLRPAPAAGHCGRPIMAIRTRTLKANAYGYRPVPLSTTLQAAACSFLPNPAGLKAICIITGKFVTHKFVQYLPVQSGHTELHTRRQDIRDKDL
jgi:hypothetical protein